MKIKTWDDVDLALSKISDQQALIAAHKGEIDQARAAIAELEPRIEAFVREHEDELQERSRALAHGRVWLRSATSLVARSWAKALDKIIDWGRDDLIRTKLEPDKTAIALLGDDELKIIGVKRETQDVFGYEAA